MAKRRNFRAGKKGINALLSNINQEIESNHGEVVKQLAANFAMLPIVQITPNAGQPRKDFDEYDLKELSESIRNLGVIQPITVRRTGHESYQIISGERRYKASKRAGLNEIPAYIRIGNDQELLEMALVENIQRKDLNAIEIANSYSRLIVEFDLTHEKLADRVGKKRSAVTNYLRLLKLTPAIQSDLKHKNLSMGHARVLAGIQDLAFLKQLHRQIIDEKLSVRATEALAAAYNNPKDAKATKKPKLSAEYERVRDTLKNRFSTKIDLKVNEKGKGQIVINFSDTGDLNRILDLIEE